MAPRGTETRDELLRAAEYLFARQGVGGTRTKQIVERAGQGNDSAVQYHFGSRQGLLEAILGGHLSRMERQWLRSVVSLRESHELGPVVDALIGPLADELLREDGRDFLRIVAGIAGWAGVRTHALPTPLHGTALAEQLALLEQACLRMMPEDLTLERIAMVISMLTAALADRAHRIDEHLPVLLDHKCFVANLVVMVTAALLAPPP
jgi:AcrR family transcriptional regulator